MLSVMYGRRWGTWGLAVMAMVACSSEPAPSDSMGSDDSGGIGLEGGSEAGAGDDEGIDVQRLDVAQADTNFEPGTAEGANQEGCKKVDFVFVVDSSPSMEDEQDNLIRSFPGFISAIEQNLDINDFHLMVVDAGHLTGRQGCDGTLGAGQISDGNGNDCGVSGGNRFVTTDQANLVDVFSCMASRGIDGPPNEQTMAALLASAGELSQPGACNEGFLRNDAVLVVTIITDEEDDSADVPSRGGGGFPSEPVCGGIDDDRNSPGNPSDWTGQLLAAKGNDPNAVVVLGLIGDCDVGDCPAFSVGGGGFGGGGTITGAEPAPRIREFVNGFTHGSTGPVCAEDYAPFFDSAVQVIQSACNGFSPPVG